MWEPSFLGSHLIRTGKSDTFVGVDVGVESSFFVGIGKPILYLMLKNVAVDRGNHLQNQPSSLLPKIRNHASLALEIIPVSIETGIAVK